MCLAYTYGGQTHHKHKELKTQYTNVEMEREKTQTAKRMYREYQQFQFVVKVNEEKWKKQR